MPIWRQLTLIVQIHFLLLRSIIQFLMSSINAPCPRRVVFVYGDVDALWYPNIKQFLRPSNNSCKLTINKWSLLQNPYKFYSRFTCFCRNKGRQPENIHFGLLFSTESYWFTAEYAMHMLSFDWIVAIFLKLQRIDQEPGYEQLFGGQCCQVYIFNNCYSQYCYGNLHFEVSLWMMTPAPGIGWKLLLCMGL